MTKIILVDSKDAILGSKERDEIAPGDIYRVSALWLTNSVGEVLMAQRAFTKKKDPGVWGPAVAGTVEDGESYDENMVKETFEELGLEITINDLQKGPKFFVNSKSHDYFTQWYLYSTDKPAEDFTIPPEEVAQVRWFQPNELKERMRTHPEEFTYAAPQWSPYFLK